eukprot:TRINITY_DN7355_c0_g1_i1.p1 TRINITY_DN7355_c0_g1~~TRINITY_DN7355_c0_g1_i1.p1  ORF type:complete len:105 (-),score=23.73 TRINITY_DN7355_c0_g1_i1:569-883(-)
MDNKTKTVRFAIQKPTFVNSVDPADTINKHISRKISLGYAASPRLIVASCLASVFAAYVLNKFTKKPIPKTITPEWEQANREYSKKNHANYEAISAHKIGSTDV